MSGPRTVALALVIAAGTASARPRLQGSVALSAAYNDNALRGAAASQRAVQTEVRPQLTLVAGPPRAQQRLEYALSYFATVALEGARTTSHALNNRLEYGGVFLPSPTTDLSLGAAFAQGQLTLLSLGAPSDANPSTPIPGDNSCFFGGNAREYFAWAVSPRWRIAQSATVAVFVPVEPASGGAASSSPCTSALRVSTRLPSTYSAGAHLAFERLWQRDGLMLDGAVDYIDYRLDSFGLPRSQLLGSLRLRWRHDFGHFFAARLDVGATIAASATVADQRFYRPLGAGAIVYTRDFGEVELLYEHAIQPNLYIAQTFENDRVALRGALPLAGRGALAFAAAVAYQYGRLIDVVAGQAFGSQAAHLHSALADATLSYTPRASISLFLRYQLVHQVGAAERERADVDPNVVPTLTRNIVLLGISGTYPDATAPRLFVEPGARVDGADRK